jgi:TonB family protein
MGMITSRRVCLTVAAALIITTGCKGDRPSARDATPETAPVVQPPAAPAVDAGADRVDAATDTAAVGLPKTNRKPHQKNARPQGGGGAGVSAVQATGNQPKPVAEAYIRGKVGSLLSCYAEKHPGQHGRLHLKLTINERGVVELAEVIKSTVSDDDGQMCVVQAIRRFKFPPPPGGGQSTVTFQLGI